jgi:hypothetical protein
VDTIEITVKDVIGRRSRPVGLGCSISDWEEDLQARIYRSFGLDGIFRYSRAGCRMVLNAEIDLVGNMIPKHCIQLWSTRSGHRLVRVGTARPCYICSNNIHLVRNRSTLSIVMELLLLRLKFMFYYKLLSLKIELLKKKLQSPAGYEIMFLKRRKKRLEQRALSFPP